MNFVTMVRYIGITFVLLAISSYHTANGVIIGIASDIISIVTRAIKLGKTLWDIIANNDKSLMDQLEHLDKKSDFLKIDIEAMKNEIIIDITETVPGLTELFHRLSRVFINSRHIKKAYNNLLHYIENPENYNPNIIEDFAFKMISEDSSGLGSHLEEIHGLVVLNDATSISAITLLLRHMEEFLQYTKVSKSPQQLLRDFLYTIIYTEIKGYLTIQFSYRILQKYQGGNFKGHVKKSEKDFAIRINNTINAFNKATAIASRELWKNDPVNHIEDVTYTELKRVFQEYIVNEYDISTSDSCYFTCDNYGYYPYIKTKHPENRCYYKYKNEICKYQRPCMGHKYNCRKAISTSMHICRSNPSSNRRYQYINFGNGQQYGLDSGTCDYDLVEVNHHYSPDIRWCDSCMCVCDDLHDESERLFNLEPSIAQIKNNYVVTGVKLVKQNRIIHIQIQEGQLLPNGIINESTVTWAPIKNDYAYYHKLVWDESRGVNLDDIQVSKNHVLTGLSFTSEIFKSSYTRLHLKIFSTPFNFSTGNLLSNFQEENIHPSSRDEIKLNNLDIPTRMIQGIVIKSKSGQYLKFTTSGLRYDVGQSTLPFIDIQEVTANPPVPMSGAGFYHKCKSNTGGFLALKLFTYDFQPYIKANLPENFTFDRHINDHFIPEDAELRWFFEANELKDKSGSSLSTDIFKTVTLILLHVFTCYYIYNNNI